jgi:AraC family transcriptional regulator, melibiose operon regulatory protein
VRVIKLDTVSWICNFLSSTEISKFIWRYYINEFKPGWIMPSSHTHKAVEIIFVIDGCGFMRFDNDVVKIIKNNTLIIPSEKAHQFYGEKNCSCKLINIHIDFGAVDLGRFTDSISDFNFFTDLFNNNQEFLKLTDYEAVESTMKRIVFEMNNKTSSYETLVKLYFCELFILLSRLIEENKNNGDKASKKYVTQAVKFIEDSLVQDLTTEIISREVHISPDYLHHIFRDSTGFSVMEFVTIKRIDKSKELLKATKKKITEIASLVGLPNSQYFSTLFKKYTGMTPNQYRKLSQMLNNRNSNIFE